MWRVFTDLTEYRLYEDLRRGWRVVQPNLEHVGLLRVGYRGLESLCADNTRWQFHPSVAAMPAAERETISPGCAGPVPPQAGDLLPLPSGDNATADSPAGRTAPQRVLGPRPRRE